MLSHILLSAAVAFVAVVQSTPLEKRWQSFNYWNAQYTSNSDQKVRGVNIGGWLVLEPFINTHLFEAFGSGAIPVDEYHFTQALGKTQAQQILQDHWATWYTEQDFKDIANAGLNHVRIPIGYWAFELLPNDPYVQGQVEYLDNAIQWARNAGLKVWIDLHGVPGSQNGFDNSGLRDRINWLNETNHVDMSLSVLDTISQKYAQPDYNDVVTSIELVNEPLGPVLNLNDLTNFYYNGYDKVRDVNGDLPVTIQGGFFDPSSWNGFLATVENTLVDHHQYQIFSVPELQRDIDEHVNFACDIAGELANTSAPVIVGEWTGALTDCAKWLNGAGRGSRWDGTYENTDALGSCTYYDISLWSWQDKTNFRRYIEAQLDSFERGGAGWLYWCWKTENAIEWDMKRQIQYGLFPQPLEDRQYPNQCGFY